MVKVSTVFPKGAWVIFKGPNLKLKGNAYEVVDPPPEWIDDGHVWVPIRVEGDLDYPVQGYFEDRFELISLPMKMNMPDPDWSLEEIEAAQEAYEQSSRK